MEGLKMSKKLLFIQGVIAILALVLRSACVFAQCVTITNCPSTAYPGQSITVGGLTAPGYGAHMVAVYFSASNCSGQLAYNSVCSAANGSFSLQLTIPSSTPVGPYYIYAYVPISTACGGILTGCSCINSESKTIDIIQPCTSPVANVENNSGYNTVLLTCTASGGSGGGYSYKWYSGTSCTGSVLGTSSTLPVSSSGSYSCKAYISGFESTCYDCDDGYATVYCTSPTATVNNSSGVGSVVMTCTASGGSGGGYQYKWYSGTSCTGSVLGTNSTLTVYTSGNYACKVYIANYEQYCFGCDYGYANVSTCTSPTATVDDQTGYGSVTMECIASGGSGGGYAYKWYSGTNCTGAVLGTNPTLPVTVSGNYACKVFIDGFEDYCYDCDYGYATVNALAPIAEFSGTPQTVVPGGSVTFQDLSTGNPISWEWTFEGGDPATYSGQTPPSITYTIQGTYDVGLIVSNPAGSDTLTKADYITVNDYYQLNLICIDADQFQAIGGGIVKAVNHVKLGVNLSGTINWPVLFDAASEIEFNTLTNEILINSPGSLWDSLYFVSGLQEKLVYLKQNPVSINTVNGEIQVQGLLSLLVPGLPSFIDQITGTMGYSMPSNHYSATLNFNNSFLFPLNSIYAEWEGSVFKFEITLGVNLEPYHLGSNIYFEVGQNGITLSYYWDFTNQVAVVECTGGVGNIFSITFPGTSANISADFLPFSGSFGIKTFMHYNGLALQVDRIELSKDFELSIGLPLKDEEGEKMVDFSLGITLDEGSYLAVAPNWIYTLHGSGSLGVTLGITPVSIPIDIAHITFDSYFNGTGFGFKSTESLGLGDFFTFMSSNQSYEVSYEPALKILASGGLTFQNPHPQYPELFEASFTVSLEADYGEGKVTISENLSSANFFGFDALNASHISTYWQKGFINTSEFYCQESFITYLLSIMQKADFSIPRSEGSLTSTLTIGPFTVSAGSGAVIEYNLITLYFYLGPISTTMTITTGGDKTSPNNVVIAYLLPDGSFVYTPNKLEHHPDSEKKLILDSEGVTTVGDIPTTLSGVSVVDPESGLREQMIYMNESYLGKEFLVINDKSTADTVQAIFYCQGANDSVSKYSTGSFLAQPNGKIKVFVDAGGQLNIYKDLDGDDTYEEIMSQGSDFVVNKATGSSSLYLKHPLMVHADPLSNSLDFYYETNIPTKCWLIGETLAEAGDTLYQSSGYQGINNFSVAIDTNTYKTIKLMVKSENGHVIMNKPISAKYNKITTADIEVKLLLEGPFAGGGMNTQLNTGGHLPLSQPYDISPWNYSGSETVSSIPGADVVDWVLVELRDAPAAYLATATTAIARRAGFLHSDGRISDLDGTSPLSFTYTLQYDLYAVVYHRNHLSVMTANALVQSGGFYSYDFSNNAVQAYGGTLAQNQLIPGTWGLIAADGDANGQVNNVDKNDVWKPQSGSSGYKAGDFNMNAQVDNIDKNDFWKKNSGKSSQVPGSWSCGQPFFDSRDGEEYGTVQIGTQCWMKENLNVGTMISGYNQSNNGIIEKFCYNDSIENCDVFGGLYHWDEMMQYVSTPGVKGICPDTWHIPTEEEYCTLATFIDPTVNCVTNGYTGTDAGTKMKSVTGWFGGGNGTNASGFSALPAGYYNGGFNYRTYYSFFRTSSDSLQYAYSWDLKHDKTTIARSTHDKQNHSMSVRCLKDENQPPAQPSNPSPSDGSINQAVTSQLSWTCSDPDNDPLTYDVFFGTSNPPAQVGSGQTGTTFNPGTLSFNTKYYWKVIAHDDHSNTTEGPVWQFTTTGVMGIPCPGFPTVTYGGQVYNTVQIGTQCWFAENLNIGEMIPVAVAQTNNSIVEKYCYGDEASNCGIYGGLYQWNELMQYVTTPGVKGICPTDWHIPTDEEFCTMSKLIDPTVDCNPLGGYTGTDAGLKMKSQTGWAGNGNGTNSSGFNGLPGGWGAGGYQGLSIYGMFRTSSEWSDPTFAWSYDLYADSIKMARSTHNKVSALSVRCIKDDFQPPAQPCPGTPTVTYGGQVYNTVQIGSQCWLAENLNIGEMIPVSVTQTNNSNVEKYCYNDALSNCDIYGGLYQWDELMQYVTTPGVKGICPADWHIPTDDEFCALSKFVDPTVECTPSGGYTGTDAGLKMKSVAGWYGNGNGTNSSSFNGLPAGWGAGIFQGHSIYGMFRTSSECSDPSLAWSYDLSYDSTKIGRSTHNKGSALSVRCIKD